MSALPHADFVSNLATVLGVAAVTTVVFQRLRQPVVLGYMLAGFIVGPHLPVPLVADESLVHTLSEIGVILLMFSLGLEFSLRKLVRVAPSAGLAAAIECGLMIWLGYLVARGFGWTGTESIFTGAMVAISSTTIIVKAFAERKVTGKLAETVFGVLIVEDLIAILLLAVLTATASGATLSALALAKTVGRLGAFLAVLVIAGLAVIPRLMRLVVRLERSETTVVASVGVCFSLALLARSFGYSVALGAFLAGALVCESGEGKRIEHLIEPVRDVFAAIFFVSVGMLIEPAAIATHWRAVLGLSILVVVGKLVGVSIGAFLTGKGVRTAIQAGMSQGQIGEFSFIIVGVGTSLGVVRGFLYPVAAAVSALTALLTPWLIRAAGPTASTVDRRLPHAIQTYAALYASWVEQLGSTVGPLSAAGRLRRTAVLLVVDASLLGVIALGVTVNSGSLSNRLASSFGFGPRTVGTLLIVAAAATMAPFAVGAVSLARRLAFGLAHHALPRSKGALDLTAAPRRALVVTLELAILLGVGVPLVALTQPFLPSAPGPVLLGIALIVVAWVAWRSATDLHGHVRAGAQVIAEALAAQAQSGTDDAAIAADTEIKQLIPGIGDPATVIVAAESHACGRTLKALNLRGVTGATALAIRRAQGEVVLPTGNERLEAGDALILAGSAEAVAAARALFGAPGPVG